MMRQAGLGGGGSSQGRRGEGDQQAGRASPPTPMSTALFMVLTVDGGWRSVSCKLGAERRGGSQQRRAVEVQQQRAGRWCACAVWLREAG